MNNQTRWRVSPKDIIEEFESVQGLFGQVFGPFVNWLIYYPRYENTVNTLEKAYWFKNIRKILTPQQNNKEIMNLMKHLFRTEQATISLSDIKPSSNE